MEPVLPAAWSTRTLIVFGAAAVALGTGGGCTMPVYGGSAPPGDWSAPEPNGDAGSDAKRDPAPDADAPPYSCYEPESAGTYTSGAPALHQNKATAADLADFFAACFDTTANQQTCDAYIGVKQSPLHTDVVNCVFPFYNPALTQAVLESLPPSALLLIGESGIALNVDTCRALAVGAPAGCAQKYADSAICIGSACEACDTATRAACLTKAATTGCAAYVPDASCDTALSDGAAAADAVCGPSPVDYADNAKFKAAYTTLALAMCGP